jgi:hypothetical protein
MQHGDLQINQTCATEDPTLLFLSHIFTCFFLFIIKNNKTVVFSFNFVNYFQLIVNCVIFKHWIKNINLGDDHMNKENKKGAIDIMHILCKIKE